MEILPRFTLEITSLAINFFILTIVWILYGQVASLFRHFCSSNPVVLSTWADKYIGEPKSTVAAITDAYYRYSKKSQLFRVEDEVYVLPPSAFAEARKVHHETLSSSHAIDDAIFLNYFLGRDHADVVNFVRQDVSRSISAMLPFLADEIQKMFKKGFPPTNATTFDEDGVTWYETPLYNTVLGGVGCIASRMFAGKKYAEDIEWTGTAAAWANNVIISSWFLKGMPSFLLPVVTRFVPAVKRVQKLKDMVREDVFNYIDTPAPEKKGDEAIVDGETILLPMLVKYVQKTPKYQGKSKEQILSGVIGRLVGLMFAAIDTTTMTTTNILYDLISNPRSIYVDAIKKEYQEALAKHNGLWTVSALGELRHLDSFIKESQRMHAVGLVLGARKVMPKAGYTFSSSPESPGSETLFIPAGARVTMPLQGVHFDPQLYTDPDTFKGFRFADDPVPSSQPSDKFMSFGHGRHACPGRNLALVVLKLIVIEFLTNYEYKEIERPADMIFATARMPNFRAKVTIRRVQE